MPCDAILIDGSCVVDEGMLTGAAGAPPRVQPLHTWLAQDPRYRGPGWLFLFPNDSFVQDKIRGCCVTFLLLQALLSPAAAESESSIQRCFPCAQVSAFRTSLNVCPIFFLEII